MANKVSTRKWFVKCLALMSVFVGFSIAQQASASTAANARIQNQVTVTYTGGSDTAAVYVTVKLIEVAPNISAGSPVPATIASTGTSSTVFTLTSASNGPTAHTFTLDASSSCTSTCNTVFPATTAGLTDGEEVLLYVGPAVGPLPGTLFSSGDSLSLGATTYYSDTGLTDCTAATPSDCVITVPNDAAPGGGVNGISDTSEVVIGGEVCSVTVLTDPGPQGTASGSNAETTLQLFDCTANPTGLAEGSTIFEQLDVTMVFDPSVGGTQSPAPGGSEVITIVLDVDGNSDSTNINLTAFTLTVDKYVKNITTVNGTGCSFDFGNGGSTNGSENTSGNFCPTATVEAAPGEFLEYLIVVENGSGSDTAAVKVTDIVPEFVNYISDTVRVSTDPSGNGTYTAQGDAFTGDNDEVDVDTTTPLTTIYIYANATNNDQAAAGDEEAQTSLTNGDFVYIIYKVQVQ